MAARSPPGRAGGSQFSGHVANSRAAFWPPGQCGWDLSFPQSRCRAFRDDHQAINRAGPAVRAGSDDVWAYEPFNWHARYASFPSGHSTTAFAALVAIGAIFPQARALMWIYAVLIALSRVMITAHHPSDVIAGAIVGAVGAFLVRNWFAARRLGFTVGCRRFGARRCPAQA